MPDEIRKELTVHLVSDVGELLKLALEPAAEVPTELRAA